MNSNATAQMVTTTQVGCSKSKRQKMTDEEFKSWEKAALEIERLKGELKQLGIEHDDNVSALAGFSDTIKQLGTKNKKLRELLEKIQPFAKAWAMEDLCDEIEEAIKPTKGDHGRDRTQSNT